MKLPPKIELEKLHRSKKRIFVPSDFARIIQAVPEECPLVGGQAVAWWALQYGATDKPLTSCDIDYWGFRDDLLSLAKAMKQKPIFPHDYEMTAWVGGIPLQIKGEDTIVEFISSVPGLDVINPEKASVGQVFSTGGAPKKLLVLSPVSLVLAKLHALRAYDQAQRQDELHLKVSLITSRAFISQLLKEAKTRQVFWNVERLIAASQLKPYQRLEAALGFSVLAAVPIQEIEEATTSASFSEGDRERLQRFMTKRWPSVEGNQSIS